jgi:hypothetical protein
MKKMIFGLNIAVGLFLVLGTAGSADLNLISFKTMFIQAGLGMWLFVTGVLGMKSLDPEF